MYRTPVQVPDLSNVERHRISQPDILLTYVLEYNSIRTYESHKICLSPKLFVSANWHSNKHYNVYYNVRQQHRKLNY